MHDNSVFTAKRTCIYVITVKNLKCNVLLFYIDCNIYILLKIKNNACIINEGKEIFIRFNMFSGLNLCNYR